MKKTLLVLAALVATSLTGFSQGNVLLSGSLRGIWTTAQNNVAGSQGDNVALLFYTSAPDLTAIFATAGGGSPTNSTSGNAGYSVSTAWTALLAGAIQVNGPSSSSPAIATITGTTGTFSFNSSTAWAASNLSGSTTYSAVEIAWNPTGGNTTIALAAANNALVGWSKVFSYTTTTGATAPANVNTLANAYGVGGVVTPTPEPGTMALAALGGASLLLVRRRK